MELAAQRFPEPQVPHRYRWQVCNLHLVRDGSAAAYPPSTIMDTRNATISAEPPFKQPSRQLV